MCTGFPLIKLDLSNAEQGCCIQSTVWAHVLGVQRLFDSLSDRGSNERHEGAGKTAVSWVSELLYSQSRVRVVGSQLSELQEKQKPASLILFILPL